MKYLSSSGTCEKNQWIFPRTQQNFSFFIIISLYWKGKDPLLVHIPVSYCVILIHFVGENGHTKGDIQTDKQKAEELAG